MRFTSMHWSLQGWSEMAEAAGFVIDAIREVGRPIPRIAGTASRCFCTCGSEPAGWAPTT
ncbi:hypothetical protein BH23ACT2_BH23ACT2_25270 [soil metagenome]